MISDFLKKLIEQGWTQQQLAEKTGLKQPMIGRYLKGQPCTLETAIKIADAFGITLDELAGRTPPEEEPPAEKGRTKGLNCYSHRNL